MKNSKEWKSLSLLKINILYDSHCHATQSKGIRSLILNASQNGHFHGSIWELIPEDTNRDGLSNQVTPWIF